MASTRKEDPTWPKQALVNITLVIPAFEPGEELIEIVRELSSHPFRAIVVVDDGSGERFRGVFDQLETAAGVTLLHHATNRGKGAALKSAIRRVSKHDAEGTSHIVTLDADGQHSTDDIVAIAHRCLNDGDKLIMGVRTFSDEVPLRSRFGNLLTRRILRWASRVELQDTQTGLRCFPLTFAEETLALDAERYEFELECILLAKRLNLPIVQHPITTIYVDENASSHFRPIVDSLRIYLVFARYALVSGLSFLLDVGLFTIFHYISGQVISSTYAARLLSGSFNFYFNKHAVFRSGEKHRYTRELLGYITLAVIIASLSGLAVKELTPITGWHAPLVKIMVDAHLFILSFLAQRFVVFRQ